MRFKELPKGFWIEKRTDLSGMMLLHYHEHYEMYVLLSGRQNYFIESETFAMPANSVCLVRPHEQHRTQNGLGGYRFNLNFDDSFLNRYFTEVSKELLLSLFDRKFILLGGDAGRVEACLLQMEQARREGTPDGLYLPFVTLIGILSRCAEENPPERVPEHALIDTVTKYIQENYRTVSTLDDAAKGLFISKYYVCHLFSEQLGTTFGRFLTDVRVKHAREYLLNGGKSITEIAELCGFHTTARFCYVFRASVGLSPLRYRKAAGVKKVFSEKR